MKLTKEQAIIITGYTGVTCCNFGHFHEDVESRMGFPVWTHQFANEEFMNKVKELYKEDFMSLCYKD